MKAQQRKQLETNVLADRMGRLIKDVRRGPSRLGLLIFLAVVLAIGAGLTIWVIWVSRWSGQSELWTKVNHAAFMTVTDRETGRTQLSEEFSKTYRSYNQSKAARFQLAYVTLWEEGVKKLFNTSKFSGPEKTPAANFLAVAKVEEALVAYENLYKECKGDPVWEPEALYNMAVAQETLSVFKLKYLSDAENTLKSLLKEKYGHSSFAKKARERLKSYAYDKSKKEALTDTEVYRFYSALHDAFQEHNAAILKMLQQRKQ